MSEEDPRDRVLQALSQLEEVQTFLLDLFTYGYTSPTPSPSKNKTVECPESSPEACPEIQRDQSNS